eukprot:UN23144
MRSSNIDKISCTLVTIIFFTSVLKLNIHQNIAIKIVLWNAEFEKLSKYRSCVCSVKLSKAPFLQVMPQ